MTDRSNKPSQRRPGGITGHVRPEQPVTIAGIRTYEKRDLNPGEKPRNVVLHFDPRPPREMLVACLWARWTGKDEPELHSFCAITDDPPPEIAATGHNRCVVPLRRENIEEWLRPESVSLERLDEILSDRERPFYEDRIAA